MATDHNGEGEDDGPSRAVDTPSKGHKWSAQNDHCEYENPRHEPGRPEAFEDLRDLLEEVRPLHLLLRRAPGHVVRKRVREDSLRYRDGETAEEEEATAGVSVCRETAWRMGGVNVRERTRKVST